MVLCFNSPRHAQAVVCGIGSGRMLVRERKIDRQLQSQTRRDVPKDPFLIDYCVPHEYDEAVSLGT